MKRVAIVLLVSVVLVSLSVMLVLYSPAQQGVTGQQRGPPNGSNITGNLPASFDKAINLTNNTEDSVYGQVAASEESVYVVWQDSVPAGSSLDSQYSSRNYDIFMMKSNDGGETFGPPVNLSSNPGFSEHPQASAYQDNVYVVWADNSNGVKQVMFSRSEDRGLNFEKEINLSDNTADSFNQEIAASRNHVYIVWLEETQDRSRVLLRASEDGGETFEEPIVISEKANRATLPKVAADDQGVHVSWSLIDGRDRGLYYSVSRDGGQHFEGEKRLSDDGDFGEPQVVARSNTVFVISGGLDQVKVSGLFLAKSFDGGASFSSETIDLNGFFANPLNVEAAIGDSDSILYVAGQVFVSGDEEILLMPLKVQPNLTEVSGLADLSNNERISECPSIAVSGDRLFVVWEDLSPGNHEILYAKGQEIESAGGGI